MYSTGREGGAPEYVGDAEPGLEAVQVRLKKKTLIN